MCMKTFVQSWIKQEINSSNLYHYKSEVNLKIKSTYLKDQLAKDGECAVVKSWKTKKTYITVQPKLKNAL